MFSSDVSARGMDYPDVSFVLQVGLTEREQYVCVCVCVYKACVGVHAYNASLINSH